MGVMLQARGGCWQVVGTRCGRGTACHRGEHQTCLFFFPNYTSISLEVISVSKDIVLLNATLLNILFHHAGFKRCRRDGMSSLSRCVWECLDLRELQVSSDVLIILKCMLKKECMKLCIGLIWLRM